MVNDWPGGPYGDTGAYGRGPWARDMNLRRRIVLFGWFQAA